MTFPVPWGQVARWLGWVAMGTIFADWWMVVCLLIGWFVPGSIGEFFRADKTLLFYVVVYVIVLMFAGMLGPACRLYRTPFPAWHRISPVFHLLCRFCVMIWLLFFGAFALGGWFALMAHNRTMSGILLAMLIYFVVTFVEQARTSYMETELVKESLGYGFLSHKVTAKMNVWQVAAAVLNFFVAMTCIVFAETQLPVPDGALPPGTLPGVHALGIMMFVLFGTERWLQRRWENRRALGPAADAVIHD